MTGVKMRAARVIRAIIVAALSFVVVYALAAAFGGEYVRELPLASFAALAGGLSSYLASKPRRKDRR